jgi:penicillin-binding protein 2
MAEHDIYLRSRLLRAVAVLALLTLVVNLFVMMVVQHDKYKQKAKLNREEEIRVVAPRGHILDRHGLIVADNNFMADITVPRDSVGGDVEYATLERLITLFELDPDATRERLRRQKERRTGRLVVLPNASMDQIMVVRERGRLLPDVRVESRWRRGYPDGARPARTLAHILGYVGEVGQADVDYGRIDGYRPGDQAGKQGVEATFEDILRGRNGWKIVEVDAAGGPVGRDTVWSYELEPGRNVQLAISYPLQAKLDSLLAGRNACGVALRVDTGEVLAAVSLPSFDPQLLSTAVSAAVWENLVNDPAKPFFNRIVQASYPPGSLYKAVTSLAGLQLGVVGEHSVLDPCTGGWTFGNRYFRCWKRSGHGSLDHVEAMAQSCDTFYYQLGLRLDIDQLAAAARALGLGRRCCHRVFADEEVPGNVPDRAWYDQRFGVGRWTRGVMLNNAIGQGEILVTPLQMAVLAGRLATGGRMPDPVFVIDPPQVAVAPEPLPFSEAHLRWARDALRAAVAKGTGSGAALPDVAVAGKTGTAQNPHGEDHAWFMCWAPASAPEVALAVVIENAGSGGTEAAPVAREWLRTYFALRSGLDLEPLP